MILSITFSLQFVMQCMHVHHGLLGMQCSFDCVHLMARMYAHFLQVAIVFPTSRINFVQQANISMHCLKCPTKDNLQSSVEDIKMKVLSPVGNSSTCEVSSDFTQLICDIIVVRNGNDVPFFLNITLFPCSSPYTVYMNLSSSLLGPFVHDLFNGTWSIGAVNTGNNARAHAGVTEQCEAIILEVRYLLPICACLSPIVFLLACLPFHSGLYRIRHKNLPCTTNSNSQVV